MGELRLEVREFQDLTRWRWVRRRLLIRAPASAEDFVGVVACLDDARNENRIPVPQHVGYTLGLDPADEPYLDRVVIVAVAAGDLPHRADAALRQALDPAPL